MNKILTILVISTIFISCCNQKQKSFTIKVKLSDGSWEEPYSVKLDEENPGFKIDCYSYDCGTTGLFAYRNCVRERISQPSVIDYQIIN